LLMVEAVVCACCSRQPMGMQEQKGEKEGNRVHGLGMDLSDSLAIVIRLLDVLVGRPLPV